MKNEQIYQVPTQAEFRQQKIMALFSFSLLIWISEASSDILGHEALPLLYSAQGRWLTIEQNPSLPPRLASLRKQSAM